MTYDRFGDGYDSARAFTHGLGAPAGWQGAPGEDDADEHALYDDLDADAASDVLEAGVLDAIGADAVEVDASPSYHSDDADMAAYESDMVNFQVQMMVMESQHNANMMAISGIGGYHDANYNGYIDARDVGMTNNYGGMGY